MKKEHPKNIDDRIREGFPKQRLSVVPANVQKRCGALPMVGQLYVTDLGSYPSAPHHYVERPAGATQAILICCLHGKGQVTINGQMYPVQPGHVVIIPPNTSHVYQADEKEPWSICWIHFTGQQTTNVLDSLGTSHGNPLVYVPDIGTLRNAFEDVYATLNYRYSDAGLLAMTSELLRLLSRIKLHRGHLQAQRQSAEDRVLETVEFMEQHIDMPLSLEELATRAGQSIPYYSKLFKERTNQSPVAYFLQLKIEKACRLLDQTEMTVREIAEQLGYDDPYYFSRIFKKVQGNSPAHYRQDVKG